ncbi:MAG: HAMP domain-containing sensor histidine kinase [Pseudomonadota bacterium]
MREPMMINQGLRHRLVRNIVLQLLAIGLAAFVGIWAAALTIENLLIEQALEDEATYYWSLLEKAPDMAAPDTRNLTGYLARGGNYAAIPPPLRDLGNGVHSMESDSDLTVVHVSQRGADRLVLVFEGQQVRELSVLFGLAPLALVLIVVYVGAWWSYQATRRAISPVEWLAQQVNRLNLERPDPQAFQLGHLGVPPDSEVVDLANALVSLTRRVNSFVDRERYFTRDASHELRSPLTVIQMSADVLLADPKIDAASAKSVERIKRAASDMVELVDAFLLLARESEMGVEFEPVCVNDVVADEVERTRLLANGRPVQLSLKEDTRMLVETSDKVLSSMLGNLIRSAADYTEEGEVCVRIGEGVVEILDDGPCPGEAQTDRPFEAFYRDRSSSRRGSSGYAIGLTIVRRLCERFNWPLVVESQPGEGTRVVVRFPQFRSGPVTRSA